MNVLVKVVLPLDESELMSRTEQNVVSLGERQDLTWRRGTDDVDDVDMLPSFVLFSLDPVYGRKY